MVSKMNVKEKVIHQYQTVSFHYKNKCVSWFPNYFIVWAEIAYLM
jgi:hypothetical protein